MKKTLKVILIIFLLLGISAGGWYVYSTYFYKTKGRLALSVVPSDAIFVVETSNLTKAWTEISSSKVWQFLTKNPYFNDLEGDIKTVDSFLKDNKIANMVLSGRKLLVSAHMTSGKDWDFVFTVDMKKSSVIRGGLKSALGFVDGYAVSERAYKGEKIIQLKNKTNPKDLIFMAMVDNLLVVSFTGALLEKAISQKDDLHWEHNQHFKKVRQSLGSRQLFRFYFNYAQLNKFSLAFMTEESDALKMMSTSLRFSAFDAFLEDEQLNFEGYTNIDSVGSYVKALAGVKPGKMSAFKVVSDQAAMYFSLGFQDFNTFYTNLTEQYRSGSAEDMEDIEKIVKMTEKTLKINLKKHFFDWIGNEIAIVKLRPSKKTRMEDVVAVIHANDIDKAKEGWETIVRQIGKRSPVKFDTEVYKNFEIRKLKRRGFFKLFFGKMFKNLEKPYYTYIDDYLVLSNSLPTLKMMIDDYTVGNTLEHKQAFIKFKDNFDTKSNVTLFIQTPKIYQNLYYYSPKEDRKAIKENRDFILSFAQIGFQLVTKGDMFDTKLIAAHDPLAVKTDELEKFEKETSEDLFMQELLELTFKPLIPSDSLSGDKDYIECFQYSQQHKYEGQIENSQFASLWKTYYPSGNIQSSVTYEDGKAEGEAFFFFDDVAKTKKAQVVFEGDEITGDYYEYYSNGARKAKIEFDDGQPDGDAEFYYKSGNQKIKAGYKDGKKHGRWKFYDEKGAVIGKEKWRKGVRKR